jgi:hypothetical protein
MEESKFMPLPPNAVDLVEATDAIKSDVQAEQDNAKMSFFCAYWPQIAPGILLAIEQLKWPWWKFAAQAGVTLVNMLHNKICNVPE